MTQNGKMVMNPDLTEAFHLRSWYDINAEQTSFQSLSGAGGMGGGSAGSDFTLIAAAEADRLGAGDKADYFTIKGTISALKRDNCLYKVRNIYFYVGHRSLELKKIQRWLANIKTPM